MFGELENGVRRRIERAESEGVREARDGDHGEGHVFKRLPAKALVDGQGPGSRKRMALRNHYLRPGKARTHEPQKHAHAMSDQRPRKEEPDTGVPGCRRRRPRDPPLNRPGTENFCAPTDSLLSRE